MANQSEINLDAALATLARDSHDAAPRPDPDMMALVMADAAVTVLAREAADAAPRPTGDLVARVLADAAEVCDAARTATAGTASAGRPATRRRAWFGAQVGLRDLLFGWQTGAVAAMGLALIIGAGVGFEMEPGSLPVLDGNSDSATMTLASLETDLLDVDGL